MLYILGILFFICALNAEQPKQAVHVNLKAREQRAMKLLIVPIGKTDSVAQSMVARLVHNLGLPAFSRSGFSVTQRQLAYEPSKKDIQLFATQGFPIALFLTFDVQHNLCWRLYDTATAHMIAGKKAVYNRVHSTADLVSDGIWQQLTNKQGLFSTKLAFCKEEKSAEGVLLKHIFLTSPFGTPEDECCMLRGGRLIAPRWNDDAHQPLLLFSRCTEKNVCLMSATMQRQCKMVSNFDGLNMLPAFSPDGSKIVYCLSPEGATQLYCYENNGSKGRGRFVRITHNNGNNVSPSVRNNGDIIFCSDYRTGRPEIFYYHAASQETECIAYGFCSCPQWCEERKAIAYCKSVDGTMQLFLYEVANKTHRQLTRDTGDKEEVSWSPCGTYLAYSVDSKKASRIAVRNVQSNEQCYVTSAHERCTFPAWSPCYYEPIIIA